MKVEFFLYLIKQHTIMMYGGVRVKLPTFLTSV